MRLREWVGTVIVGGLLVGMAGCPGGGSASSSPSDTPTEGPPPSEGPSEGPAPTAAAPTGGQEPEPLPAGVKAGERAGEYVHEKSGIVLVWVPPGKFSMGSDAPEAEKEKPVHEVTLSRGFFLGKHEVTVGQYLAYCEAAGVAKPEKLEAPEDHPVAFVSWDDAQAFCSWAGLRLPSEAEWEWAARGSDGRAYPWGNDEPGTTRANMKGGEDGHEESAPVGSFPEGAAACGALDMGGNVVEWCQDWYAETYPSDAPVSDPTGPSSGTFRCFRGGAFTFPPERARATDRAGIGPTRAVKYIGFRVALSHQ